MWYEILPSAGIVFTLLYIPTWSNWIINRLTIGKDSIRFWDIDQRDYRSYWRDRRITGDEYKIQGLEGLPEMPKDK
ncbi:uncharacterized protein LOC141911137 [Tubulanus polymorphus]|uniref:uncharacterized protein LOC141911137 n=1 Tax=Tubulanus polymorphus TaxID=672921 RepID=UPI003DA2AB77